MMVFAAASLEDVLRELGDSFGTRHGMEIIYNFAGSNILARQIEAAPGADLFLSADQQWMDYLEERDRVVHAERCTPISNRLAVIVNPRCRFTIGRIADLARAPIDHLALADPAAVPAGRYARAYLESLPYGEATLWDALAAKVVPAVDVRSAVALVESDARIAGLVYRTEARRSTRVRTALEVAPGEGPEIAYAAAVLRDAPNASAAHAFLAFLRGKAAAPIWEEYGFVPLAPSPAAHETR